MAIKELQTRIALKYDSYANWTDDTKEGLGANLVLLKGELGICAIEDKTQGAQTAPTVLFKVGDGENPFKSLKWASALAADVYSWAKSETVVLDGTTIKFKTGDTVNHTIDLSAFATDAEVEAIRSGLDSRITALEGRFDGENSVQGQIDALDGRLDTAEGKLDTLTGADTVDGSVAKALKDAKAYADTKKTEVIGDASSTKDSDTVKGAKLFATDAASAAKSGAEATADAALTAYKAEMTTALAGKQDVIAANTYDAYGAAAAVKTYVDNDFKTAIQGYADQAEADAKSYADGELSKAVSTINAKDLEQDTAIGNKLDKTTYEAYIADKSMSDEALKGYADGAAGTAKTEAIAAAKTETETQINTLVTSGQVKTNTDAIAQNKADIAAMDTAYKKAVSDEAKARDDADKALDERLDAVEAFFVTADGETLDTALDTLVEIQDYLNGEGEATGGMIGRLTQAETDIDNLEKEFTANDGRVKVAEGKITALEAADEAIEEELGKKLATSDFTTWKNTHENDHAPSATQIASNIAAAVSGEASAREAADTAINEKIGGSYSKTATVEMAIADAKAAGTGAASEATRAHGRLDVVEPKVTTLQDIVNGYTDKGSIKTAIDAAQAAADDAQDAADAAQGEIDALELVVGNETTGLAAAHTKANTNAGNIAALTTRVTNAEGAIDALEATVDTATTGLKDRMTAAEGNIQSLQSLTGDAAKGNVALYNEITRVANLVDDNTTGLAATKVIADRADAKSIDNASRIKAIEDDYVKATDLVNDFYIFNCGTATTVNHTEPANQ